MSMIEREIERLEKLRDKNFYPESADYQTIGSAIDTIKTQSEKLHAYAMERSSQYYHGGWIPCSERLPDNAKGELCPRYLISTKYGVTEGWYNPNFGAWYILLWTRFPGKIESIDFKGGDQPCIAKFRKDDDFMPILAWQPLPKTYKGE